MKEEKYCYYYWLNYKKLNHILVLICICFICISKLQKVVKNIEITKQLKFYLNFIWYLNIINKLKKKKLVRLFEQFPEYHTLTNYIVIDSDYINKTFENFKTFHCPKLKFESTVMFNKLQSNLPISWKK